MGCIWFLTFKEDTISINHNWTNACGIFKMWEHLRNELVKVCWNGFLDGGCFNWDQRLLILHTLISIAIFSILFPKKFFRYWQREFVYQSRVLLGWRSCENRSRYFIMRGKIVGENKDTGKKYEPVKIRWGFLLKNFARNNLVVKIPYKSLGLMPSLVLRDVF